MKPRLVSVLFLAAGLLTGCNSEKHARVLEPVGPAPLHPSAPGQTGRLLVFSAYDPNEHFNSLPYEAFYTDYKILAADGQLLRKVSNNPNPAVPGPTRVELPAGEYQVVARANGYGTVTVPVVIAAQQTTTVHLEGGGVDDYASRPVQATPVRLPHGQVIGWQTLTKDPASPAPLVVSGKDQREQNTTKAH